VYAKRSLAKTVDTASKPYQGFSGVRQVSFYVALSTRNYQYFCNPAALTNISSNDKIKKIIRRSFVYAY